MKFKKEIIEILKNGGVGVLATDTIYGVVGQALNKKTVERIYKVRKRNPKKPLIILISCLEDLKLFNIKLTSSQRKILNQFWPGKYSIILPCKYPKFKYLHRGTNTIATRFPKKKSLVELLKKTGPLVAPSANPEGLFPAKNIREAKKYFGNKVDFYCDSGEVTSKPSKLVEVVDNKVVFLR